MGWESDEMSRLCLLWRGAGENGIVARALLSWAGVVAFPFSRWGQKVHAGPVYSRHLFFFFWLSFEAEYLV